MSRSPARPDKSARRRLTLDELAAEAELLTLAEMHAHLEILCRLPNFLDALPAHPALHAADLRVSPKRLSQEQKAQRNREIRRRYKAGEATIGELAMEYNLSRPRVWRILQQGEKC